MAAKNAYAALYVEASGEAGGGVSPNKAEENYWINSSNGRDSCSTTKL